jgi:hypothetical protein
MNETLLWFLVFVGLLAFVAYLLRGQAEFAIRGTFGAQLLDYFEGTEGLAVEGSADRLLFYRQNKCAEPHEIHAMLADALQVLERFRQSTEPRSVKKQFPTSIRISAFAAVLGLLAGCNIAGGIGERHMPDANYNDGENYAICLQLTAPGGNASKAFTEAHIMLDGVRAGMTKTVDTKDKVEFVYMAKTADLVGKIPKYHFEYSTARGRLNIHTPAESISKPVSAEPDTLYDSIDQIKFDPPIVRFEMGEPYTYKQFQATLYDKEGNEAGEIKPYYLCGGGWYISYRDSSRPITVYKRRAK